MNGLTISISVAVSTSIFALIVIFSNLYSNSQNEKPQATIAHIPAILQENDNGVEQNNNTVMDKTQIDPLDAILVATKNVSAQPSDLRSIALEMKNGYPAYSMDIFNSASNNSVEVTVNAISGKAIKISQDLDDRSKKLEKDVPDEFNE